MAFRSYSGGWVQVIKAGESDATRKAGYSSKITLLKPVFHNQLKTIKSKHRQDKTYTLSESSTFQHQSGSLKMLM